MKMRVVLANAKLSDMMLREVIAQDSAFFSMSLELSYALKFAKV